MTKFVKFNLTSGEEIYINPSHVSVVRLYKYTNVEVVQIFEAGSDEAWEVLDDLITVVLKLEGSSMPTK